MSGQLGIGVRVYVGWCPDSHIESEADPRCKTGTITEGPWQPGEQVELIKSGETGVLPGPCLWWVVTLDTGEAVTARESILTPIDDNDPPAEQEQADRPQEVEA